MHEQHQGVTRDKRRVRASAWAEHSWDFPKWCLFSFGLSLFAVIFTKANLACRCFHRKQSPPKERQKDAAVAQKHSVLSWRQTFLRFWFKTMHAIPPFYGCAWKGKGNPNLGVIQYHSYFEQHSSFCSHQISVRVVACTIVKSPSHFQKMCSSALWLQFALWRENAWWIPQRRILEALFVQRVHLRALVEKNQGTFSTRILLPYETPATGWMFSPFTSDTGMHAWIAILWGPEHHVPFRASHSHHNSHVFCELWTAITNQWQFQGAR